MHEKNNVFNKKITYQTELSLTFSTWSANKALLQFSWRGLKVWYIRNELQRHVCLYLKSAGRLHPDVPTVSVWSASWHRCFPRCLALIHITVHKSGHTETFMTQLVCCTKESGQVSTHAGRQQSGEEGEQFHYFIQRGERLKRNQGERGGLPHCTKPWQRTDCLFLPSKEVERPGASSRRLQRCNTYHANEPHTHTLHPLSHTQTFEQEWMCSGSFCLIYLKHTLKYCIIL